MSNTDHETFVKLAVWYAATQPRRMDIVGDFGGKQLFIIDGDSLLHYSITTSVVDYDVGFQLLHAIFAVESFLKKLQVRGCNFHVVFFDNQAELCAPSTASEGVRYKYQMTRAILIQHLRRSATTTSREDDAELVFSFPSIDSQQFHKYLTQNPATFLLCHDGHAAPSQRPPKQAAYYYIIHQFLQLRHGVGLIYGTEFKSSRVIVPMIMAAYKIPSIAPPRDLWPTTGLQAPKAPLQLDWTIYEGRSYRELLTAVALCRLSQSGCVEKYEIMTAAIILHDAIISHTKLEERALALTLPIQNSSIEAVGTFLKHFCQEVTNIMESDLGESLAPGLDWDVFDIIDGRLFLTLHSFLLEGGPLPTTLIDKAKPLFLYVEKWSGISLLGNKCLRISTNSESQAKLTTPSCRSSDATILPFNHELLNSFLEPVHLQTTQLYEEADEGKVFRELTHWHNAKVALDTKGKQSKPGFFARKRNQKFMADTLVYSASLTNATGKLIEPQTIVVGAPTFNSKSTAANHSSKALAKPGKKKKLQKDSGKDSAREAALLTQARKSEQKNRATLQHWHTLAQEYSKEEVLFKRFQKCMKYFSGLTKEEKMVVGAEVSLYLCDTLHCAWEKQVAATSVEQALGIGSLLFNQIRQTSLLPGSTQEVSVVLRTLNSAVKIPNKESIGQQMVSRQLGFHPRVHKVENLALLPLESNEFQLRHCGPFLERTFDSRKDDRVPFEPDAWQRSVLDSIDANESLFIVAPTSSGKTFISFYAMEKVLRGDDDGVLVYVAPTKALVNQIAAEVQARFHKKYHHEGRSVWAIHTRDYRVNNPTGCQVLVTVPHVLQIMLLSPSNANSWSKRVKRIIFDEVHCIGQADDGIIWEQLLLMAPCPIIALSATVGNPEELCEWLRLSQKAKGFSFRMITHSTRYSDLRAFHYAPPKDFEFKGLRRADQFPVPGLDRPNRTTSSFQFIHPIATLINRAGVDLEELNLEPRDAQTLWEEMNKCQTPKFPVDDSLRPPQVSSGILRKSDVLAWTQKLKAVLATWMQDDASPFDQVCYNLDPDRNSRRDSNSGDEQTDHKSHGSPYQPSLKNTRLSTFALLCDLHKEDGLPAILFDYDRIECERALEFVLKQLQAAEEKWKESNKGWQKEIRDYNLWKASKDKGKAPPKSVEKLTKQEQMREEANTEISRWESFDPDRPLEEFSFADNSRLTRSELESFIDSLKGENIRQELFSALERGIAVHHAGMNRRYRQVVEILFRKGFLTAVIATGTLALGINMPCKTVAFVGDSAFLTALNYRQGAGRAGRRGFDLLGNVVFSNISKVRAYDIMSSRLPDLKGHFPLTTTLVLRVLGLVDAAGQSSFASGIVKSLLTQNRLYLGGKEAGKSIQHHLRFSVEYLQRQHLLSADGKPINFAGLVGHLYFTENAVFAFHSLLKSGYFHRLCSNIKRNTTDTLRTLGLVMAHLFNRIELPILDTKASWEAHVDSRSFSLPRLPVEAEDLLIRHNNETLEIFKAYASTFIDQYLDDAPDRTLPLTGITVGGDKPRFLHLPGSLPTTKLRSSFSALSGHSDDFKTIHELCSDIRSGVFLEESAVPYIPIWPYDVSTPFNSYIYDFLKHGDYIALTRDNKIKKGDVWFLLRDFSLVLATIVASLTNYIRAETNIDDDDMVDLEDLDETPDKYTAEQSTEASKDTKHKIARAKPTKKKVVESWEDEEEEDDTSEEDIAIAKQANGFATTAIDSPTWEGDGKGLVDVLNAFTLLKQDFDEKFHKAWA